MSIHGQVVGTHAGADEMHETSIGIVFDTGRLDLDRTFAIHLQIKP